MTMRNSGSHRPSGSLADITTKPVNRLKGHCEQCGSGVSRQKRFCSPCYDVRLQANIAANRHKYQKKKSSPPKKQEKVDG